MGRLHSPQKQAQAHLGSEFWGLGYPENGLELWSWGSGAHLPGPVALCSVGDMRLEDTQKVPSKSSKDGPSYLSNTWFHGALSWVTCVSGQVSQEDMSPSSGRWLSLGWATPGSPPAPLTGWGGWHGGEEPTRQCVWSAGGAALQGALLSRSYIPRDNKSTNT